MNVNLFLSWEFAVEKYSDEDNISFMILQSWERKMSNLEPLKWNFLKLKL